MSGVERHVVDAERASLRLDKLLAGLPSVGSREKARQALRTGKEPKDIAPAVVETLLGPQASEAHRQRLLTSMAALHKESYIKTVEATAYYDRSADLPNIKVPTLLVYGADDRLTPPKIGRRMQADIPDAEFVLIAAAGHLVNIEQPHEFNRAVLAFLRANAD